jgi:hypothetical protein
MATKKKPTGWNSLTKAQQEAWKKKNFDRSTKVTEAQLNKLRKEGTPTKAIAKYKGDPSMREALNRFYGKDRVNAIAGTAANNKSKGTPPKGSGPKGSGPGYTRKTPVPGGPGAKTGKDGRMSSSTKKKSGLTNQEKLMLATGGAALGVAVLKGKDKKPKAIGPGPIGRAQMNEAAAAKRAAAAKTKGKHAATKGKHAAPGKTVKTPLTRTAPGRHAAPKGRGGTAIGKPKGKSSAPKVVASKAGKVSKASNLSKVAKVAKVAGLSTPLGRAAAVGLTGLSFVPSLKFDKLTNTRRPQMGNPKKNYKKK